MTEETDETPELDPYRVLYDAWYGVLQRKEATRLGRLPESWDEVEEPLRGAFVGALSELRRQMRAQQSGDEQIQRDRKHRKQLNEERQARRVLEVKNREADQHRRAARAAQAAAEAEVERLRKREREQAEAQSRGNGRRREAVPQ